MSFDCANAEVHRTMSSRAKRVILVIMFSLPGRVMTEFRVQALACFGRSSSLKAEL
jgi:hypothetical protein